MTKCTSRATKVTPFSPVTNPQCSICRTTAADCKATMHYMTIPMPSWHRKKEIPMKIRIGKCITFVALVQFFLVSAQIPAAHATIISTQVFMESTGADQTRQTLQAAIAREDVRAELVRLGVNPADAENRLAQLSAEELQQLQDKMDELPAGGSALAIIGAVFLVLLILELVGVTNVFSKI